MHEEFKETFKRLALSFSEVERAIKCPKNYLSRFINGTGTLPSKWEVKIHQYMALASLIKPEIKSDIEKVTTKYFIHDITCSANPEKPMGTEGCSCEMYRRAKRAEKEVAELKEKIKELEADAGTWRLRMAQTSDAIANQSIPILTTTSNKPDPALQITKEGNTTKDREVTQEEAEKRLKKKYDQLPGFLKPENDGKEVKKGIEQAKSNSKELSPFLKSRQNAKNGM